VRQALLFGGQGVRVSLRSACQLCLPVRELAKLGPHGVQVLLSLRDPVADRLRPRQGP
jgi:hypothetical protein